MKLKGSPPPPPLPSSGPGAGIFFNPTSIGSYTTNNSHNAVLTSTDAMAEALLTYARLSALSPHGSSVTAPCDDLSSPTTLFAEGHCLMIFGFDIFKVCRVQVLGLGFGVCLTIFGFDIFRVEG